MDNPNTPANAINKTSRDDIRTTAEHLENEIGDSSEISIKDIVITSAKKIFFTGGDIKQMLKITEDDAANMLGMIEDMKAPLRRLEKLPVPIVVTINGAVLGDGLEAVLGANHRVVADVRGSKVGLPEVTLGLPPGGGGVSRVVRMLGVQDALMRVILTDAQMNPAKALAVGLVDGVIAPEQLIDTVHARLTGENTKATQPQDEKDSKIPGDDPKTPKFVMNLPSFPANLIKQLKGSLIEAPHLAMQVVIEGSQVNINAVLRIESRYFTELVTDTQPKSMMQVFFFDLSHAQGGGSRPLQIDGASYPKHEFRKAAVANAGMMGAGTAYMCTKTDMEVILKDISLENAERGRSYSEGLETKALKHGRTTEEKSAVLLSHIRPTKSYDDLADVDLIIEAVLENTNLKHKVHIEAEAAVLETYILDPNTSTLPITELTSHVKREKSFIGLYSFSPVDKMQLIGVISNDNTDPAILAASLDSAVAIRRIPIVIIDSRGSYTSHVIGTAINRTLRMVAEGYDPAIIEVTGRRAGCLALQLQLADELNLKLMEKIAGEIRAATEAAGQILDEGGVPAPVEAILHKFERPGKLEGKGFYEYVSGRRPGLQPGLFSELREKPDVTPIAPEGTNLQELVDRMLFIEVIEAQKYVDEDVLLHDVDSNIGSIFGIDYPAWTGGTRQFIKGYDDVTVVDPTAAHPKRHGVADFAGHVEELAAKHGERFSTSESLKK